MRRNKNRKFKTKNRRVISNQKIRARRYFRTQNRKSCSKGRKSSKQQRQQQTSMRYTFHWIIGESKKTPLGDFINSINEKVSDLSDLVEDTYATMQKEYEEKMAKITEPYKEYEEELEAEYQKLFKKYLNDGVEEYMASQMASHESGQMDFENHQQYEEHELYDRNATLSGLFFKSMLITLYSIIESEVLHEIQDEKIPIKFDYSKKKTREIDFLKLILNNNDINELRPLDYVSNLRLVRNSIVHNKSILYPVTKKDHKDLVPILEKDTNCALIKKGDSYELSISNIQFIRNHIRLLQVLLNQSIWAIDKGDEYNLLKSRLFFLLKYSDKDVTIESIDVAYTLKKTVIEFKGVLPSHSNTKFKGLLTISDKLDQTSNCLITSDNDVFKHLVADAKDFLHNTTLRGFVCKELKQKVKLELNVQS